MWGVIGVGAQFSARQSTRQTKQTSQACGNRQARESWMCSVVLLELLIVCRDPSEHVVVAGRNREYMVATTPVEDKQRSCCAVLQYRGTKTYNNSTVTVRVHAHYGIM